MVSVVVGAASIAAKAAAGSAGLGALTQLGLFALTTAAGFVDSLYLFPEMFGDDGEVKPERLQELDLQTAHEGAPFTLAFGRRVKVSGHIMWSGTKVQETRVNSSGKGAGNQSVAVNRTFQDIAVMVNDWWSQRLLRVWANGEVMFGEPERQVRFLDHRMSATESGGDLVVTADTDGPDFRARFEVDDLVWLQDWDDANITGFYVVLSVSTHTPGAGSSMTLAILSGQNISGLSNVQAGNPAAPGRVERADDAVAHEDLYGIKNAPRGFPTETFAIYSQAIDWNEKFSGGDHVRVTNFDAENKDIEDGTTAVSVSASPQRFTSAGTWTRQPVVGQQVVTSGFVSNNGTFTVTAVTSSTFDVAESTTAEGSGTGKVIEGQPSFDQGTLKVEGIDDPGVVMATNTGAITEFSISGTTITRTTGRWPFIPRVGEKIQLLDLGVVPSVATEREITAATATTIDLDAGMPGHGLPAFIVWPANVLYGSSVDLAQAIVAGLGHVAASATDVPNVEINNVDKLRPPDIADSLTYHPGRDDAEPDSIIEAEEGVGEVPGYINRAYFVVKALNLGAFGGGIPQFQALLKRWERETIGSAFNKLFFDAGFATWGGESLDKELLGWSVRGPVSLVEAIGPILIAHDIITQERGEVLWFFPRRDAEVVSIDQDDLGTRSQGERDKDTPITVRMESGVRLPDRVELQYTDAANFYEPGAMPFGARNPAGPERRHVETVNLRGLTAWPWDMKDRATELFRQRHLMQKRVEVSLGPKYIHVLENDVLTLTNPDSGEDHTFRVLEQERKHDFGLVCRGPADEVDSPIVGSQVQSTVPPPPVNLPEALIAGELLDIPAITPGQEDDAGIYICAAPQPNNPWRGAFVYESIDNGQTFERIADLSFPTMMGELVTDLPAGPTGVWHSDGQLRVRLFSESIWGGFQNRTRSEVQQGANWLLVGDEILGFTTANENTDGSWTLSELLRGIRDTKDHTAAGTTAGARVVFLQAFGATGTFVEHRDGVAANGKTRQYKFVPAGGVLSQITAVSHTHRIEVMRPFAPHKAAVERDGSNNVTLTWERRSRELRPVFHPGPNTLVEAQEEFEVHALLSGSVVRRWLVVPNNTGSPFVKKQILYPATGTGSQTADGITPGDPIHWNIWQIGQVGRGNLLDVTL